MQKRELSLLIDLEKDLLRTVNSNGHEKISFAEFQVFPYLAEAGIQVQQELLSLGDVDLPKHINGSHNGRNIVYDRKGSHRILELIADFSVEDSNRGRALQDMRVTKDVVLITAELFTPEI